MRKVRICVVGTGGIFSGYHFPVIKMMNDRVELVAVCDRDPEVAARAGTTCGVPHYTDFDEMLDKHPDAEIVYVTVYMLAHHELAVRAARGKRNVFIEKPMAMTRQCADLIISECRKNGVRFEVAENFPLMPRDQLFARVVREGIIGDVQRVYLHDPINPFNMDIGVHRLSQMRESSTVEFDSLVGIIQQVAHEKFLKAVDTPKMGQRNYCDPLMYHRAHAIVNFRNGAKGIFECSPTMHKPSPGTYRCRQVIGTKGIISDNIWPTLHGKMPGNDLVIELFEDGNTRTVPVRRKSRRVDGKLVLDSIVVGTKPKLAWETPFKDKPFTDWQIACACEMMSLVDAVVSDKEVVYGEKGRQDLEYYFAIVESDHLGVKEVKLALPPEPTALERRINELYRERFGRDPLDV